MSARVLLGAGAWLALALGTGPAGAERLPIRPVMQQTHVWCWVAVGEMVFRHLGIASMGPAGQYQCGIIGLLAVGTSREACVSNCGLCVVPAGSAEAIRRMLEEYPRRVAQVTGRPTPHVRVRHVVRALSQSAVVEEIAAHRPIVAGISPAGRPPGGSAHVALIVGQEADGQALIVNDPYPFSGSGNAYLAIGGSPAGAGGVYRVPYEAFRQGLAWTESFTVRVVGASAGGPAPGPAPPPAAPAPRGVPGSGGVTSGR